MKHIQRKLAIVTALCLPALVRMPLELKIPVFFWCKAWSTRDTGIWKEFGPTKLTFLEYLLIGIASSLFPRDLLNKEGVNRE